ncbi:MAG: hypothetical protein LBM13_03370 [Candidatus Ancillula sp.]|jgi:hypothetical protein|nr:hypothetical protein [Candidatus Ancillula sp.]
MKILLDHSELISIEINSDLFSLVIKICSTYPDEVFCIHNFKIEKNELPSNLKILSTDPAFYQFNDFDSRLLLESLNVEIISNKKEFKRLIQKSLMPKNIMDYYKNYIPDGFNPKKPLVLIMGWKPPEAQTKRNSYHHREAHIEEILLRFGAKVVYIDQLHTLEEQFFYINKSSMIVVESAKNVLPLLSALKYHKNKVIIDFHDIAKLNFPLPFEPEYASLKTKENFGSTSPEATREGLWRLQMEFDIAERFAYLNFDKFIYTTNTLKRHVEEVNGAEESQKKTWIQLPIFYEKSSKDQIKNKTDKIVYSGTVDSVLENIDLMMDLVELKSKYQYKFFGPQPNQFSRIFESDKSYDVFVGRVARQEVITNLLDAKFGLILRDDLAVNRAANPTKLIEFLMFGVIPIVKTPYLGDFYDMGYSYIEYKDFIADNFAEKYSDEKLQEMRNNNLQIVDRITAVFNDGNKKIENLFNQVLDKKNITDIYPDEVLAGLEFYAKQNKINRLERDFNNLSANYENLKREYNLALSTKAMRLNNKLAELKNKLKGEK